MREITLATLQVINDRVFPYDVKSYEDWNELRVRSTLLLNCITRDVY